MSKMIRALPAAGVLTSGIRNIGTRRPAAPKPLGCEEIVARLEAAGATLLAMPASGYSTHLRQMKFDIVHTALEAYGWQSTLARPALPNAFDISMMDEAFGWLALIPDARFLLRRILGARALVHPLTGRHLFTWRRLAATLGADHKSVQRWHGQGVEVLARALAPGPAAMPGCVPGRGVTGP